VLTDKQLVYIPPGEEMLFAGLNGSISIYAPESLTHLGEIDPKKIGKAAIAKKKLRDLIDKREALGKFGWTLCIFPTAELAKQMKRKLGFNQSALHWDFVNTEKKRVSAHLKSGKNVTIYENGKFNY
jgi:hypothetical protein